MRALFLLLFGASIVFAADTDSQTSARRQVLQVAGAFSNDGFKIRDGYWTGEVKPGEPRIVLVNLYAGNQYWFSAAAADDAKRISIQIYNEQGVPVESEPYEQGATTAAGITAEFSGPYYIKLEELEGTAAAFCLVYSYK